MKKHRLVTVVFTLLFVASAWSDDSLMHNGVNGWSWTTTINMLTDEKVWFFYQDAKEPDPDVIVILGIRFFPATEDLSVEWDWGLCRPSGWDRGDTDVSYRFGKGKVITSAFNSNGDSWLFCPINDISEFLRSDLFRAELLVDRSIKDFAYDLTGLAETIKLAGAK